MTPVFLDTVGILAILDEDDQWHAAAQLREAFTIDQHFRAAGFVTLF